MYIKYEGADFKIGFEGTIERSLLKQVIKKKIGKVLGKSYHLDPYLDLARNLLERSPSSVVIDVGANIGTTVLPLAVIFPAAKFYAIEPHPIPAARFMQNCQRNRIKNVSLLSTAVGLEKKMVQIYTCPTNSGGHRVTGFNGRKDVEQHETYSSIMIPMMPLNRVFQDCKIDVCEILKIDTEGYEVNVLASLGDDLQPYRIKNVIAELGPEGLRQAGKSSWDLVSMMLERGYSCCILGSDKRIENEKDMPVIPDFTVVDLLFSTNT